MPELIIGMAEFERKLRQLDLSLQRRALIEAATAGAKLVRDVASDLAPRDTGELAEEMTTRVSGSQSDVHEASVDVGPSKNAFYGMFQEFGTVKQAAQPFLEPAFEQTKEQASQIVKDRLLQAIHKVAG